MIKNIKSLKFVICIFLVWGIFSSPYLFAGKTPYPSNYQVNSFAPAASYPENKGPVKNNAQPDIIGQIYPWRHFSIEELKAGRIPFWNPYSFAGTPHLANYQSAVLFPLNILFFLPVSFIKIWGFLVLLQPLLAGVFIYILMRRQKVSELGSLISSFSFMFCGFIVTWMGYSTLGYAILPLPLALFCIVSFRQSGNYKWLAFLSFCVPLSFFAGHFQTSIYFFLSLVLFIVYNLIFDKNKKSYLLSALCIFFGLLFCMPQILPSIELYGLSVRSGLFQKFEAIPLNYLVTLISPDFFGNPVTRNDWFGHYAEWNGYSGVIPFSIALFAVLFVRNKITGFYIVLGTIALLLAYDTPLLSFLVALKVPVLSTSAASRIIVLFSFATAVLAGFGFDVLSRKVHIKRFAVWISVAILLFGTISILGFIATNDIEKLRIAQKNLILPIILMSAFYALLILTIIIKNKKLHYVCLLLILLLVAFEMYRFASKWQNFDPESLVYQNVGITKFYNSHNRYDRALGLSGGEDGVYYRIPILSGYDPLYKAEYGELIQFVDRGKEAKPERSVVTFPLNGKFTPDAINLFGVKYIVHKTSDGSFPWAFPFNKYPQKQFTKVFDDTFYHVYKNNYAYPRTYLVSNAIKMDNKKQALTYMFSHNLRENAVVDQVVDLDSMASGKATIVEYLPNKVTINTKSTGKSLLVLTDNYYPGWSATVNGRKTPIYKTNYSFRGIVVPKGDNTVTFSYVPDSFLIGIYLALLGGLGIIITQLVKYFKIKK